MWYKRYGKRLFDLVLLPFMVVLLFFPFVVACIYTYLVLKNQIFFKQWRVGKGERIFLLLKLRTMDLQGLKVVKSLQWIRKCRLDEVPQLWLIGIGKMSFIGPRPLLPEYQAFYTDEERKRFGVLPGITGFSQMKGGDKLSWNEKLYWDSQYAKNLSFILDFQILIASIGMVFKSQKSEAVERLDVVRSKCV